MTQDEIIHMAREAGSIDSEDVILTVYAAFSAHEREKQQKSVSMFEWQNGSPVGLRRENSVSIEAAVLAEREACAKVASSMVLPDASNYPFHIAAVIRARGEK